MNNEAKRRRRAVRQRCLTVLAALAALVGAAMFFLPFVTFRLSGTDYTFTSLQVVTGYMNVKETAVSLPMLAKIAAAVCPAAFLAAGCWWC